MIDTYTDTVPMIGEKDLRRQIDRAISRALFDGEYAGLLLADPTVVLEDYGCPPQQYLSLRGIQADDLSDFARQAQQLFWIADPLPLQSRQPVRAFHPEERRLAAVAAR